MELYDIKIKIERNSKRISEYNQRIQELRVKLDKLESQIKWAPAVDLTDEDKAKLGYTSLITSLIDVMPCKSELPSGKTRSVSAQGIIECNVRDLQRERDSVKKELDYVMQMKEKLREENLVLREELNKITGK